MSTWTVSFTKKWQTMHILSFETSLIKLHSLRPFTDPVSIGYLFCSQTRIFLFSGNILILQTYGKQFTLYGIVSSKHIIELTEYNLIQNYSCLTWVISSTTLMSLFIATLESSPKDLAVDILIDLQPCKLIVSELSSYNYSYKL